MELKLIPIDKPEDLNFILGQSHFIKTVEDLHETLAGASPQLRFGLAFCESSGPRLVRRSGNDEDLEELATRNALAIGAGHSFIVFLRDVTERKRDEARLAELLDFNRKIIAESTLGIVAYKASGACVLANEAAAAFYGFSREELHTLNIRKIKQRRRRVTAVIF